MKDKKLYLQPDLTITQLANEMNCSKHHLSQVLNELLQKSYYDYINSLRIEEAMPLLGELIAVERRHHRGAFAREVDEDRCGRAAVLRAVIDAGQHGEQQ